MQYNHMNKFPFGGIGLQGHDVSKNAAPGNIEKLYLFTQILNDKSGH